MGVTVASFDDGVPAGLRRATPGAVPTARSEPRTGPLDGGCGALPATTRATAPPLAVLVGGAVEVLDVRSCSRTTVIGTGATGPLRLSADGRWIGYGPGLAVDRSGSAIVSPLGLTVWSLGDESTWAWSPTGSTMAGVTVQGGVAVGTPGDSPRQLLPDGWGATQVLFAGPDDLLVARGRSLWRVDLRTGTATEIHDNPTAQGPVLLARATSDWVVFWQQPIVSASAARDGAPLYALTLATGAVHTLAAAVVVSPDAVARCGDGVAASTGAGRDLTTDKTIAVFRSSDWVARPVGTGISPSCSADGVTVAYSVGPAGRPVGHEQRRVVVTGVAGNGRAPIEIAPDPLDPTSSDEAPQVVGAGDTVVFVRTGPPAGTGDEGTTYAGRLCIAGLDARTAAVHTIGALDVASDFYGRYDWAGRFGPLPD